MQFSKYCLVMIIWLVGLGTVSAHIGPQKSAAKPKSGDKASYRMDCASGEAQTDLAINNVRARLRTGGDLWWNLNEAKYVVPQVAPGETEVSSIFAGAVWLGGLDEGKNLKTACQTYGASSGSEDFWPGPLTDDGSVGPDTCANWDRFFKVSGESVSIHRQNWANAVAEGRLELDPSEIPEDVKGWPGLGNPFFFEIHEFELPEGNKRFNGLAGFWDVGGIAGIYEPQFGDFPIVEVRGCEEFPNTFPDEMIFWIYNDGGGIHANSNGDAILMEVQVQSFAYATSDEINDMSFYRYRLINRAIENIDSTYFAMWVDADLGCAFDDYVGCDTARSLAYVYNADDLDGVATCNDCQGIATYCTDIPVLGVDYFRGPLDENGDELGMSSFTYYDSPSYQPNNAMVDPQEAQEYYRYLSGSWRDGTPFSYGGSGYSPTATDLIDYAFTEEPDEAAGWSMCTSNLGVGDRRTIQASGPFTLLPGAINELIVGVVWVPSMPYPCPDMTRFFQADDIAQSLFDNCFERTLGPDAPQLDWVELDKEVIAIISNPFPSPLRNNFNEEYFEKDLRSPGDVGDTLYSYIFEGYQLYQLPDGNTPNDYNDPDQARLVAQVDVKNGINSIFNWEEVPNPNADIPGEPVSIFVPEERVNGADEGIKHSFKINSDQYASGDPLINHRDYYYTVLAYGYNEWKTFDQREAIQGQGRPYISSSRFIEQYKVTPRPITDVRLNSAYGDGPTITRIDGAGAGGNFLEITDESLARILSPDFDGRIDYKLGQGPINVAVVNPLEVKNGTYRLFVKDADLSDNFLSDDATWELINLDTNDTIVSDKSIRSLNEQILSEYGFSVSIAQTPEAGDFQPGNGALGIEVEYANPDGVEWFAAIPAEATPPVDWIKTGRDEVDNEFDPNADFAQLMTPSYWQPYALTDYLRSLDGNFLISPAWDNEGRNGVARNSIDLEDLNNVNVVLTQDKSLWSRCVVIETSAEQFWDDSGKPTQTLPSAFDFDPEMFDLRQAPSVGKNDADGDGLPDPDGGNPGMGWFPGYAIDVETGDRLNIFFGENSSYDCNALEADLQEFCDLIPSNGGVGIGRDMLWNPTSDQFIEIDTDGNNRDLYPFILGGQHFIYVTREPYDECAGIYEALATGSSSDKLDPVINLTWNCMPILPEGAELLPLGNGDTGLIPNDVTFKLRADNSYQTSTVKRENNGHPAYEFSFDGVQADELVTQEEYDEELDQINVVPNPYYGYSRYENTQFTNTVKITNLPAKCTVSIYSLDGRFIRKYDRNEEKGTAFGSGIQQSQFAPALEWDLKNRSGISIASGTYLIHVAVEGKGERVLKFFAVQRQFDPSGL